jgi:hypothetical protein
MGGLLSFAGARAKGEIAPISGLRRATLRPSVSTLDSIGQTAVALDEIVPSQALIV